MVWPQVESNHPPCYHLFASVTGALPMNYVAG